MAHTTDALGRLIEIAWRHKLKLVAYNLLVVVGTVGIILFWPRTYRSEAKIWLKIGHENSKLDPTATTGENVAIQEFDREDEIKSVIDVLNGRGVAENVVQRVTPPVVLGEDSLTGTPEPPHPIVVSLKSFVGGAINSIKQIDPISDHEEAVQEISKSLTVTAERKSNVVSISYEAASPELAHAVVTAIVEQYRAEHARIHRTDGSRSFFDAQRQSLREQVAQASLDLNKAKTATGLVSIEGHRKVLEAQLLDVRTAKFDAQRQLAEADAKLEQLKQLAEVHPEQISTEERIVPNTGRDQLQSQLYALQIERMDLEAKFQPGHPLIEVVRQQEAEAQVKLKEMQPERKEASQSVNLVHQQIELDLARAEAGSSGFSAMLAAQTDQESRVMAEIAKLNAAEAEIRRCEQELALAEANYISYSEKYEVARIDEALNETAISNISLAQEPTLEGKPVSPSKAMVGLLGIAAIFCGSLAIVSGLNLLDDSLRRPEDVEYALNAPLIVSIPHQPPQQRLLIEN